MNYICHLKESLEQNGLSFTENSRSSTGPAHQPIWVYTIRIYLPPNTKRDIFVYSGIGTTIKEAKHVACKVAYESIQTIPGQYETLLSLLG